MQVGEDLGLLPSEPEELSQERLSLRSVFPPARRDERIAR